MNVAATPYLKDYYFDTVISPSEALDEKNLTQSTQARLSSI